MRTLKHHGMLNFKGTSELRGLGWGLCLPLESQSWSHNVFPNMLIPRVQLVSNSKLSLISVNQSLSGPGEEGSRRKECQLLERGLPEHSMVAGMAAETSLVDSECSSGNFTASFLRVLRTPKDVFLSVYEAEENERCCMPPWEGN